MAELNYGAIKKVEPRAAVEGGEVILTCEGYDTSDYAACRVSFGSVPGRFVGAAPERVIVALPEYGKGEWAEQLKLESASTRWTAPFVLGEKLADNLHPVANPAIDRDDGSIYVTLSGSRGNKVPVSIYRISLDGTVEPFLSDIVNPTGLAFDQAGVLYVTSRYEGELYRVTQFKEVTTVATELGVATGVALDRRGAIYVGDRSGTIFKVNELGEARPFASLEPSVSAYHLAFSPEGDLFVSGPTVSSFENIWRIDATGEATSFYRGLGRPQGMAFDEDGNLYVAASLRGQRGIVRITPDGERAELVVAGGALVGLAFDEAGNLILTSTQKVYRVPLGIKGYSVF
jgi:sugar lactone lactonase YvrE